MTVVYDKLAFVRRLEGEGTFSRVQAEALSEAVHGAVSETVATKSDLAELRVATKCELTEFRVAINSELAEFRHEFAAFRGEIRHEIAALRSELKLWTGSLFAAQFAALSGLAAAFRFLGHG